MKKKINEIHSTVRETIKKKKNDRKDFIKTNKRRNKKKPLRTKQMNVELRYRTESNSFGALHAKSFGIQS